MNKPERLPAHKKIENSAIGCVEKNRAGLNQCVQIRFFLQRR